MDNTTSPNKQIDTSLTTMNDDATQTQQATPMNENKTGLPDHLKEGLENLSGLSMKDVNLHRNADQPAQLHTLAFAQGNDIHIAPDQATHLAHEAWHVVQEKKGSVQPTMKMKNAPTINDEVGLEKEADQMGEKAAKYSLSDQVEKGK